MVEQLLERRGHRVVGVGDGAAALARWRAGGVGVVITDLRMPGLSGLELASRIRAEEAALPVHAPPTRIVICSGSPEAAAAYAGPAGPVDDVLAKPIDADALDAVLRGWASNRVA